MTQLVIGTNDTMPKPRPHADIHYAATDWLTPWIGVVRHVEPPTNTWLNRAFDLQSVSKNFGPTLVIGLQFPAPAGPVRT